MRVKSDVNLVVLTPEQLVELMRAAVREEFARHLRGVDTQQTASGSSKAPIRDTGWLTSREAAVYLNYSTADLARKRMNGVGPPYAKVGRGKQGQVRYRRADLDAWLAELRNANGD